MGPRRVSAFGLRQCHLKRQALTIKSFDRAKINSSVRTVNAQTTARQSTWRMCTRPYEDIRCRPLQKRGSACMRTNRIAWGITNIRRNLRRKAIQKRYDHIYQMAAKIIKNTSGEGRDVVSIAVLAIIVVHIRLDKCHSPEPTRSDNSPNELNGRVRTVHVTNLHRDVLLATGVDYRAIRIHFRPTWLITMHRKTSLRTFGRYTHQVNIRCFNKNRFNARNGKGLLFCENRISRRVELSIDIKLRSMRTIIDDPDNLKGLWHAPQRRELALGMFVCQPIKKRSDWPCHFSIFVQSN
ncbi:MAG: hypothetical protein MJZ42_05430 [Bacteroidales bacterium]|nr:hypothetical protein [Bacteroidales bacterium]